MTLPFALPPRAHGEPIPLWVGNGFKIGNETISVLQYSVNSHGWNDDLTFFHEETAGDQHFIDKASRDYAIYQLQKQLQVKRPVILEVGCSSGFMLKRLQHTFPDAILMGADVVQEPLTSLANTLPGVPLIRFDMTACPLPDASVDALIMLNVLEHIEADSEALKQAYRILKPGGVLIIEVPAGPHLFDIYDKMLMHYRRYTLANLAKQLQTLSFKIHKQSHLGFFLYPPFWLVKMRNKRLFSQSENKQRESVKKNVAETSHNKLLHLVMRLELFIGKLFSYPFGIRCLISCTK